MVSLIDDPNKRRVDNDNFKYDKVNFTYDYKKQIHTPALKEKLQLISSTQEEK